MDNFRIDFEGGKELEDMLNNLPLRIEKKILQKAVREGMKPVLKAVKEAAPFETEEALRSKWSKKYGHLRKNIKLKNVRRADKGGKGSYVSTGDSFWGYILERGGKNLPARPWMLPAFLRKAEEVVKATIEEIKKGIDKEALSRWRT